MSTSDREKTPFNLSRWAIAHGSLARFLFAVIIVAGALAIANMGQKEDPDFTFRVMVVQTVWPGASIEEMQGPGRQQDRTEAAGTPHLDYIHSYTRAGMAITTINIKGDTDRRGGEGCLYQVRKKVGDIEQELPEGLMGPYFNDEFGDTFVTMHALSGGRLQLPGTQGFRHPCA